LQQIKRKHNCPNILLIGPGCVKLAVRLSKYTDKQVIAINLPATEIKENKNEYTGISNLQLSSQNIDGKLMNDKLFEMIIFCSTIEYFFSVNAVLKKALKHLSLAGEIHICGSTFDATQKKVASSYKMYKKYFPHNLADFRAFQYKVLQAPSAFINKFSLTKNPFHYIVVKNYYL
jgi:hypothetical protein